VLCLSLLCRVAQAQAANSAREHFAQGVEQAEHGDFESAAANFEQAYRLSPHYAVLYNLGQAYAALGKSIDALRAFEKYLENGGQKLSPERQTEVRQLISQNQKRIGYVAFEIQPRDANLFVDGRAVDAGAVPVSLIVGLHGVVLQAPGHQTFASSVTVESQKIVPLALRLEPLRGDGAVTAAKFAEVGQIAVDSALPELAVSLDGSAIVRRGSDPFLAPIGPHQLRCQRDGYEPVEAKIDVRREGIVRINCDLTPARGLPPSELGFVTFTVDQPGAQVWLDGRRVTLTTRLPKGTHAARIRRSGFADWSRTVTVRPGFPETVAVRLEATPEHARELARAAEKRRTIAYVLGGTGVALLGTSAALYVSNGKRYEDWRAERDQLANDLQTQPPPADLRARATDVRTTAVSIQRQDDVALGLAIAGGVLVGHAIFSWLGAR